MMLGFCFAINLILVLGVMAFLFTQRTHLAHRTFYAFLFYLCAILVYSGSIFYQLHLPVETYFAFESAGYVSLQIAYVAALAYLFSEFFFSRIYLRPKQKLNNIDKFCFVGFLILVGITLWPDMFFKGVEFTQAGNALVDRTQNVTYYGLFVFILILATLVTLFTRMKRATNPIVRTQFRYLFLVAAFSNISALITNWILPVYFDFVYLDAIAPLFFIFNVLVFIYATTRLRFLDIQVTFEKYLIYITNSLVYVFPIIAVLDALTAGKITTQAAGVFIAGIAILLVLFWDKTLPVFTQFWNYLFYNKSTNPIQDIAKSIEGFRTSTESGIQNLSQALEVKKARFCFVNDPLLSKYLSSLKHFFEKNPHSLLVKDELDFQLERFGENQNLESIGETLDNMMISVVMPVLDGEKKLLGFLLLEKKVDGSLFSSQEIAATTKLLEEANIYITKERDYGDVLQKLQNYEAVEKEFIKDLMHEIRHPLMMARNITEVIDWAKLKPEDQVFLKESERSLQDLSQNLERITEAFYWSQETAAVQKTIGNLENLREFIRQDMVKQNPNWFEIMDFKWESSGLEKDLFYFDMPQMKRVFVELGKNALFFSDAKKFKITVRAFEEGDDVVVHYTDNGIGIVEEYWDKIFDLMFVISESRSRKEAGFGLGLTIARGIIRAHGGDIKVLKSEIGKGTTFEIRAPLERYKA